MIAGEYLLAKDYIYEGVIPEGKTFSAKCTFIDFIVWNNRITNAYYIAE